VFELVKSGAGNSRVFELRAPMMVEGRYDDATMKVSVWQKDMAIIRQFAAALFCPTPLFDATAPIYDAALAQGLGAQDTAAVCAVLEKRADVRRR
jgi:3-hydroxyisobutyrate dehydrogenase-like beta-hydroxyacid dehydrogenase